MQKEFEGKDKQIGVLITNLGTPDSPTKQGLKKYLNQFLMDKSCLLYTSPSPRDVEESRMPSSA